MSSVTMSQIAEAVGVSQATVSFVLNGRHSASGSISPDTQRRVQEAAAQLGYRPNRAARALATGRSQLIGLCMWELAAPHYAGVIRQSESRLQNSPYHLLISCLRTQSGEDDPHLLESIFPWPLDGVLALQADRVLANHWERFHSWPAPIVNMGRVLQHLENLDSVDIDLAAGVRQAVAHLLEIGCRRIAFAAHRSSLQSDEPRPVAYAQTLRECGRAPEYIPLPGSSRAQARAGMKKYIAARDCPDGILCFNDEAALGVYRALCDLQIKVPQQVALIGCDGIEDTEYLEVPLSTIVQPVEEMCRLAWEMLRERIETPQREFQHQLLVPQLAIRASSQFFGGQTQ